MTIFTTFGKFASVAGLVIMASGCAQFKQRESSKTVVVERVPISVASRMRDNQPLLPGMKPALTSTMLADGRVPLNRPSLRPAPDVEISFMASTDGRTKLNQGYPEIPFALENLEVELFELAEVKADYYVEIFDDAIIQTAEVSFVDPRDVAFVKLNGSSENSDWRTCETQSRGYIFTSETDFSVNPPFEVCMRNKGYVLTTEAGSFADTPVNAKTAVLRGFSQPLLSSTP